ncbi:MAG: hypothetical protein M0P47_02795 [Bacteroidales bacterium]|nr:hypothetical protein [Bacteroidales bacterium]
MMELFRKFRAFSGMFMLVVLLSFTGYTFPALFLHQNIEQKDRIELTQLCSGHPEFLIRNTNQVTLQIFPYTKAFTEKPSFCDPCKSTGSLSVVVNSSRLFCLISYPQLEEICKLQI